LHVLVALLIALLGAAYWYVWWVWIPRRNGYRLERERVVRDDGISRNVFKKVPL